MNGKILVIDDNPINIEMLEALLTAEGYAVVGAISGPMALERVAGERPDLVLLDVVMPGMDGYEVCRRLRAEPSTSLVPVVMITAHEEVQKLQALEAGANDFIAKPFDRSELLARVKSLMQLKRSYDTILDQAARLAELNRNLEARVQEQVHELERVSRLRRYLAPQVAELIISSGDESVLDSHRREITVVFCDIRGFTGFAEVVEPEEVMQVLREYHAALGELIFRFEGTLERFAGDGLMVFFNDPIPVPDPQKRAVRMAVAMRDRIADLSTAWRKRGHELSFGVGIAQGYATLGKVGFEGRVDYGAIGAVTNLATRLCDEAGAGQILISQRVYAVIEDLVEAEPAGELQLKGFMRPITALNVVGLKTPSGDQAFAPLSRREAEVAGLVAQGFSNKDIAQALFVGERTAESHIQSILNKLGFHARTQIASWAVARGLGKTSD